MMTDRRGVIRLGAAVLLSAAGPESLAADARSNPVANPDQFAAEDQVIRLWSRPDVQQARRQVAGLWRLAYGVDRPAEAEPGFEHAMDEFVVNYLFKAAASDGAHPRFVRDFMPGYRWFGRDVPGARMGGDNPDNCYRLAGIDPTARYRVHVTPAGPEPASTTFTLVTNYGTSRTVQTLDIDAATRDPGAPFAIEIDAAPAANRSNHLRSTPATKFLFVRDSFSDWARETPHALSIERLDASATAPLSDDAAAARAIEAMVDEVPLYYWFTRLNTGKRVNTLASPLASGALGGLVTQAGTQGWFRIADDQAMVVRLDPAGARYVSLSLISWWYQSIDAATTLSSITGGQARIGADGTMTLIVSPRDPGVHNWVETGGYHDVLVIGRWQSLPTIVKGGGPRVLETRLMAVSAVADSLGAAAFLITPNERAAQRAARRAAFDRRIHA